MNDILTRLRKFDSPFGAPLPTGQREAAEAVLQFPFPAPLLALYDDHNGMVVTGPLPMRLMPIDEVIHFHNATQEVGLLRPEMRLFWTDDNSNYAGVYGAGPLAGMVFLMNHEEPDVSPRFRSVPSFYRALLDAAQLGRDWREMETDYPVLQAVPNQDVSRHEGALAREFIAAYHATHDDDERTFYAFCAMNLLPLADSEALMTFVWDEDMWIQAYACQVLGALRYTPAIQVLADVVRYGKPNGKAAALGALGGLATPQALDQLLGLRTEIESSWKYHLATALQNYGYTVQRRRSDWYYQAPGEPSWNKL